MHKSLAQANPQWLPWVQPEAAACETAFADFEGLVRGCKDTNELESVHLLVSELPSASLRLGLDLHRLDEAMWSLRGPTTIAGLNRVIALALHGDDMQALLDRVSLELHFWKKGIEQKYPPPLRPHMLNFVREYRAWLERCPQELEAVSAWGDEGEGIGAFLSRLDLDYLWRVHSRGPTPFGLLNLVANACWLRAQDHIAPILSEYYIERLSDELQSIEEKLPPGEQAAELAEIGADIQELIEHLRKWNASGDAAKLEKLRPVLLELGQELYSKLGEAASS